MKILCVVCVCFFVCVCVCVWGCMCVHLAYCIIKAQKLAQRNGREVCGEEGGEAIAYWSTEGGGKNSFDWNIRGGMPHFYRGKNSRWYRGSEEKASCDGEEKRTLTARM